MVMTFAGMFNRQPLPQPCRPSQAQRPCTLHTLVAGTSHACRVRAEPRDQADRRQVDAEDEDFVGLTPEEDWEVPGSVNDSLSQNTKLGKAVHDACLELDALSVLEQENLTKANDLLRQLGYKGDLFQVEEGEEPR